MTSDPVLSRRSVVAGLCGAGCTVALAGCAGYGRKAAAPPVPAPASAGGAAPEPAALASAADVPVGGGVILAERQLVITQPTAGTFTAFTAVCTHQQCTVNEVAGGTINCPCHGSRFSVTDGSVVAGRAESPLAERPISVQDGTITAAG